MWCHNGVKPGFPIVNRRLYEKKTPSMIHLPRYTVKQSVSFKKVVIAVAGIFIAAMIFKG
jgi:hypothetical protein